MRGDVEILLDFTRRTGHQHRHLEAAFRNYRGLLEAMGRTEDEIDGILRTLAPQEDDREA